MSGQVIGIGEFRIRRERMALRSGCQHTRLTLHDDGDYVTCDDCAMQIGAYAALRILVERWADLQARVDAQREAINKAAEKTVGLRAAQKVEKAWRSRTMVPTCPHCAEAIFPEDGLGSGMANRELALRRRGVGAAKT